MQKYRKRRYALVCLLLCLYAAIFLGSFWSGAGQQSTATATASDIQCSRNWLLLGTRWSCTAIVTDTDGKKYRFTSDASLLTPADIGTEVPMRKFTWKRSPPTFTTARAEFNPHPWNIIGAFASVALGIAGAIVLWPRNRIGWPEDAMSRRSEAQRLRAQWPWNIAIGVLGIYSAFWVHGVMIAAHLDPEVVALPTEGTGVATSCERDWRYLGAVWQCTVEVTPTYGTELTQTMGHSQFTPADIGIAKPVSLELGEWEAANQPHESKYAKLLLVALVFVGTTIAKPLSNLRIAQRLENSNPALDAQNRPFLP